MAQLTFKRSVRLPSVLFFRLWPDWFFYVFRFLELSKRSFRLGLNP